MSQAATRPNPVAWASASYTPALDNQDLYALEGVKVLLHPLLAAEDDQHTLRYDMTTGTTQLFVANSNREADFAPFAGAPATLPRLQEIILITKASPWVTIVKNEKGVSLQDIIVQLFKDYVDVPVTEAEVSAMSRGEFAQLTRRLNRYGHSPRGSAEGMHHFSGTTPPMYGAPLVGPGYPPHPYAPAYPVHGGGGLGITGVPPGYGGSPYGPPQLLVGTPNPTGYSPRSSPGGSRGPSPGGRPSKLNALRTDWLMDRRIFDGLSYDPAYCESRLGYKAPNIFVLNLVR